MRAICAIGNKFVKKPFKKESQQTNLQLVQQGTAQLEVNRALDPLGLELLVQGDDVVHFGLLDGDFRRRWWFPGGYLQSLNYSLRERKLKLL